VALVYLGEHYVADLLVGLLLAEGIQRGTPVVAPVARELSKLAQSLEARRYYQK
jgi:hypothetical protein